jgi:hypothetical protein
MYRENNPLMYVEIMMQKGIKSIFLLCRLKRNHNDEMRIMRVFLNWVRLRRVRTVPVSKSQNIPEVVLVRRWAVGVLGIWRGGVGWVKGGANRVSLQAT